MCVCVCEVLTQNNIALGKGLYFVNIGSYSVYCLLLVAREVLFSHMRLHKHGRVFMEGFCIEIKHAIIVYLILPLLI